MEPAQPSPTAPAAVSDAVRTFLAAPRHAVLSTIAADGAPHQAPIWYDLDGDDLVINSRRGRHWPRNLVRDGRLSLAIVDADEPEHWVGIKGCAAFLRDGDAAIADIQSLARRYGGDPDAFVGQDRVTFRVTIDSTFEYGA
ncbi:MAG: PPOX class F420-dependent oxidoreductase [Chloroflexi bacterium]|nr:PPOX class F420-dependent oxidoreductase [Chloroflexota bacterium]